MSVIIVSIVGVIREFELFGGRQFEDFFELFVNCYQNFFVFFRGVVFVVGNVIVIMVWYVFFGGVGLDIDFEEGFVYVDNNVYDFVVFFVFQGFVNGGEYGVQLKVIDVDVFFFFELV